MSKKERGWVGLCSSKFIRPFLNNLERLGQLRGIIPRWQRSYHTMQRPYRTGGSKLFDLFPLSQTEPKVLLNSDVVEWKQGFDGTTPNKVDNTPSSTAPTVFEDIDSEGSIEDSSHDQFGDLFPEEELKGSNLVVTDVTALQHEDEGNLGDWPRRLLHVPSLTSFEWAPGNVYGRYSSPEYAALSYTWGRWMHISDEKPEIEGLPIQGITWAVPKVLPTLFTVDQFRCAIESCTKRRRQPDLEFIWLDIACINQNENSIEGALEIGRQAKIFGRASQTFVWLAGNDLHTPTDSNDLSEEVRFLITYSPFADGFLPFGAGNTENPEWRAAECRQEIIDQLEEDSRHFARTNEATQAITKYPWFSSLWTLQEAFLTPDSNILDLNGRPIRDIDGVMPTLRDILRAVRGWYDTCTALNNIRNAIQAPRSYPEEVFKQLAEKYGLDALSSHNPMLLYAQARHRVASRTEDRVYGIMQVFRFRLGRSSISWNKMQTFSLPDLELQLGVSLAASFPILSQLHVHSRVVTGRQAWRVSHTSMSPGWDTEVPFRLHSRHLPSVAAQLSVKEIRIVDPSTSNLTNRVFHGFFQGKTCAFDVLSKYWTGPPGDFSNLQRDLGFEFQIALDKSSLFTKEKLGIPWTTWQVPRGQPQIDLLVAMMRQFLETKVKAKVLMLGGGQSAKITLYGVVVIECHDEQLGTWWARIGICNWDVPPPDPVRAGRKSRHWQHSPTLAGESEDWTYEEGLFG
ncbi:heterokaryon incompatibility protein-domain-containing protein, partial [Lophiotrema nucula]